jgi:hypothetical protein
MKNRGGTDSQTAKRTVNWTNIAKYRQKDKGTDRLTERQTGRQAGRQTGRKADRQTGRQADKQKNK